MASLHQATEGTKQLLKWLGISVGLLLFFVFAYRIYQTYNIRHTPPPPPTVCFGKLPPVVFPQSSITTPFIYTLDTVTGLLPTFPDREPVYKTVQPAPDLNALANIEYQVTSTEFGTQQPIALSETLYMWTTSTSPFKKLAVDKHYRDLALTSGYTTDVAVLKGDNLGNEAGAIALLKDFLNRLSSYPGSTIDESKTKVTYFSINNGQIISTDRLDQAQLMRVDFYYKDLGGYQKDETLPIYFAHFPDSFVSGIVASGNYGQQIVEAHYSPKDLENKTCTYGLKTPQQAYDELQKGKAYVVSYYGTDKRVSINNIFLGYYMDESRQAYIMPIVIFQGKNGFLAYTSAIPDSWVDTSNAGK